MVNPGHPSRACVGCRALKSKCDEQQPSCRRCIRRGKPCVYKENAFRSMNSWSERTVQTRVADKLSLRAAGADNAAQQALIFKPEAPIPINWAKESISPFLSSFADEPDSQQSTWGLRRVMEQQYAQPNQASYFVDAMHACALSNLANVSKMHHLSTLASQCYGAALKGLYGAMMKTKTAGTAINLSTVLMLGHYEIISGTKSHSNLFHAHMLGQSATLRAARSEGDRKSLHPGLVAHSNRQVLWSNLALRRRPSSSQKTWAPGTYRSWLDERSVQMTILASEFCARMKELHDACSLSGGLIFEETLSSCIEDAITVDETFELCFLSASPEWAASTGAEPVKLQPAISADASPETLSNLECAVANFRFLPSRKAARNDVDQTPTHPYVPRIDTYPSQAIALLWDNIRCARLHLLRAMIDLRLLETPATSHLYAAYPTIEELRTRLSDTIHDICASVPYIIGDVTDRATGKRRQKSQSPEFAPYPGFISPRGLPILLFTVTKVCLVPQLTPEVKTWAIGILERIGTSGNLRQGLNLAKIFSQKVPTMPDES